MKKLAKGEVIVLSSDAIMWKKHPTLKDVENGISYLILAKGNHLTVVDEDNITGVLYLMDDSGEVYVVANDYFSKRFVSS